jgi:8-oxo-dGTP diphosphatase
VSRETRLVSLPTQRAAGEEPDQRAAGAVLSRRAAGDPGAPASIALIHRPRYDDWSLPKGRLRAGEAAAVAAVRELGEETGRRAALQARLGTVAYRGALGAKLVEFFAARDLGPGPAPDDEADEVRWLSVAEARSLASYDSDRAVLDRFADIGPITATVVLVRHARAGKRERWGGPDELRPLTPRGQQQASELAALLAPFAPQRIVSATPVRCQQTVGPLAASLAAAVQVRGWASDDQFANDESASLSQLRALAELGGASVVCSQGGAIPGLLWLLADRSADYETGKGAFWVLSFGGGQLAALDHYPAP